MSAKATISLEPEVVDVLRRSTVKDNILFLPAGQLERSLYTKVDKAITCLGGKWMRSAKGHVFKGDGIAELEGVLAAGEVVDKVKLYQFYPTPFKVAEMMVELVGVRSQHLTLEPSAGKGGIIDALPYKESDPSFKNLHACEIQEEFRKHLSLVYTGIKIVGDDFLQYEPGPIYDRIIANPPFTKQQDIIHVLHMLDCLNKRGRLACVMAGGMGTREDRRTRELLERLDRLCNWTTEKLPEKSFAESGTNVNALILIAERR